MIMDINILDGSYYFYLKYRNFQWILDMKTLSIDAKWGGELRQSFKEFRLRWHVFLNYVNSSYANGYLAWMSSSVGPSVLNWLSIASKSIQILTLNLNGFTENKSKSKSLLALDFLNLFLSLTTLYCRHY